MDLNKNTLSTQIYQILRNDILSHSIPLGEKLTLKMLQERFQVSSTPIRDALTRLNEEGLVEYYSNIGVNVISLKQKDLEELYQFMGDLDSLSIRYASAYPRQDKILGELEDNIARTGIVTEKETLSEAEIQQWITDSDRFHLIFYDYCENSRLVRAAERLRSQLTIFSNSYEKERLSQKQIFDEHKNIWEAYRQKDYSAAASLMKIHLDHSLNCAKL